MLRLSARRAAPQLARRAQFCASSADTPPPSEQRIRELQSTVAALHRAGSYEDAKTAADESESHASVPLATAEESPA